MNLARASWLRPDEIASQRLALHFIFAKRLVFDAQTHAYWHYQTASRFSLQGLGKPARCARLFAARLSAFLVETLPGFISARCAERFRRRHFVCRHRVGSR